MDTRRVIKVYDKRTKQEVFIKEERFNRVFHERIDFPVTTVNGYVAEQNALKEMRSKNKFIVPDFVKTPVVKEVPPMPDNVMSARKWAKDLGMKTNNTTTKEDIEGWAKSNGKI